MAMYQTKRLAQVEGVAENSTATIRLPRGWTYFGVVLTLAEVTPTEITEARLIANGDVIQRLSGLNELDAINQYQGRAAWHATNHPQIIWDFGRPNLLVRPNREVTAIGTGAPPGPGAPKAPGTDPRPISSLSIELDIGATASANPPAISARALQGGPSPSGLILRRDRFTYAPSAAGRFDISDLPRKGPINRVFFWDSAAAINELRVERDGLVVYERNKAENDAIQADGEVIPQAGLFVMDPTELGYGSDSLEIAGVQDLRFILTMAGAGALPVTVEYLTPVGVV